MTLSLPPRSTKPRTRGITSMIDFGPDTFGWTGAPEGFRNLLAACADYIVIVEQSNFDMLVAARADAASRVVPLRLKNRSSLDGADCSMSCVGPTLQGAKSLLLC